MCKLLAAVLALLCVASIEAKATCPDQSSTAVIPMSGENDVTVYDSATCNQLAGPFSIVSGFSLGPAMNATTKPAVTVDPQSSPTPGILRFTANGAPFGTKVTAFITFSPDTSKVASIVLTIGGPVTGLVFGTSSP
jgi:hypothetical protein